MIQVGKGHAVNNRELSEIAALATLFIVASFVPYSSFIGGAGFITLSELLVPVIGSMLRPKAALLAGLVGALGVYALQTSTAPVYGPVSILIPLSGILLGSLAFHSRPGKIIAWIYVLLGGLFYLLLSHGTVAWLLPYAIVIVSLPIVLGNRRWRLPLLCLYSTMCELATMTIASITLLNLHGPIWLLITPVMYFERAIASLGATFILTALKKAAPNLVGYNHV